VILNHNINFIEHLNGYFNNNVADKYGIYFNHPIPISWFDNQALSAVNYGSPDGSIPSCQTLHRFVTITQFIIINR